MRLTNLLLIGVLLIQAYTYFTLDRLENKLDTLYTKAIEKRIDAKPDDRYLIEDILIEIEDINHFLRRN